MSERSERKNGLGVSSKLRAGIRSASPRCKSMKEDLPQIEERLVALESDVDNYVNHFGTSKVQRHYDLLNNYKSTLNNYIAKECD